MIEYRLKEARSLIKVKAMATKGETVVFETADYSPIVLIPKGKDLVDGLKLFLQRVEAKDVESSPKSNRAITYKVMAQGIMDKSDQEIWVWDNIWKKQPPKYYV